MNKLLTPLFGLALVAMASLAPSCANTSLEDVLSHPTAKVVGRVATNMALKSLAAKVGQSNPTVGEALLAVLAGVEQNYSAAGDFGPGEQQDLAAAQLEADLALTLQATPPDEREAVVQAVRDGLRQGLAGSK